MSYDHEDLYARKKRSGEQLSGSIWEKDHNRCALFSIINDSAVTLKARFFAAEVALESLDTIPAEINKATLGKIYADAIAGNVFGSLNYWGMYSVGNIGPAGKHLVMIGKDAIPFLAGVLDNNEKMHYWGSKSAEVGNLKRYRAKDVAAFFILRIRAQSFEWPESPEERNSIIDDLKTTLNIK